MHFPSPRPSPLRGERENARRWASLLGFPRRNIVDKGVKSTWISRGYSTLNPRHKSTWNPRSFHQNSSLGSSLCLLSHLILDKCTKGRTSNINSLACRRVRATISYLFRCPERLAYLFRCPKRLAYLFRCPERLAYLFFGAFCIAVFFLL